MTYRDIEFLPPHWKKQIQSNYVSFRQNMHDSNEVVAQLFSQGVISPGQKEELDAAKTPSKRVDQLIMDVVLRASVGSYRKFRKILQDTGNGHLAEVLPDPGYSDFVDTCKSAAASFTEGEEGQVPSTQSDWGGVSPNYGQNMLASVSGQYSERGEPGGVAGGNTRETGPNQRTGHIPKDKELMVYQCKKKGLCVIFTNFTNHLTGYNTDTDKIIDFFRNVLNYEVHKYKNLSYDKMTSKLDAVRHKLQETDVDDDDKPIYDRVAVFVLSHGDEHGIKLCKDEMGREDSEEVGKHLTLQEIQQYFNTANLPTLKGKPKFFVFQCCRGMNIVKTAALGDHKQMIDQQKDLIPVNSDFLVSYSCTPGDKSVVGDSSGSWFLQSMMAVFKAYESRLEETSVEDMLKVVNWEVSRKKHGVKEGEPVVLRQMPCYFSTLTKKFCLK